MQNLQLKIAGQWIALPQDFTLSIEQSSPLFNEQGTFSLPFEVPLEPNRHVFRNLADPFGDINLRDINGLDAELWWGGIMLYRGKTETEEETEIADVIPLSFISGNSDFLSRIEGMNAREVPLDREIVIGWALTRTDAFTWSTGGQESVTVNLPSLLLPTDFFTKSTRFNVTDPYPTATFCNARVCTQGTNENGDPDGYQVMPADRDASGICFYLMYWVDLLFGHLGIPLEKQNIDSVEDINRVAFFTTRFTGDFKGEEMPIEYLGYLRDKSVFGPDFDFWYKNYGWNVRIDAAYFPFKYRFVYANSESFPDVDAKNIIDDLQNAFGIRFLFDLYGNSMKMYYVKDVMTSDEVVTLPADILGVTLTRTRPKKIKISYGQDDDTAFNYDDYSNVVLFDNYEKILKAGIKNNDTTCKIDKMTGNAYRVKVDEETGLGAALFEVGGFRDFEVGESISDDETENISINFTPVIVNDTYNGGASESRYGSIFGNPAGYVDDGGTQIDSTQELSVLADVEYRKTDGMGVRERIDVSRYLSKKTGAMVDESEIGMRANSYEVYDATSGNERPLKTYDAGYALGIMRGGGNDAGVEYPNINYDGEGNDTWVQVATGSNFTSDSCDNFARFFDYNGTEAGGADQAGRFSLKLVAGKPGQPIGSAYEDRGLVAKFTSEYYYFLAHKKTLTLEVDMSISDIIHVDFLKRVKIGEYVGFINKISYLLTMERVTQIEVELFML